MFGSASHLRKSRIIWTPAKVHVIHNAYAISLLELCMTLSRSTIRTRRSSTSAKRDAFSMDRQHDAEEFLMDGEIFITLQLSRSTCNTPLFWRGTRPVRQTHVPRESGESFRDWKCGDQTSRDITNSLNWTSDKYRPIITQVLRHNNKKKKLLKKKHV